MASSGLTSEHEQMCSNLQACATGCRGFHNIRLSVTEPPVSPTTWPKETKGSGDDNGVSLDKNRMRMRAEVSRKIQYGDVLQAVASYRFPTIVDVVKLDEQLLMTLDIPHNDSQQPDSIVFSSCELYYVWTSWRVTVRLGVVNSLKK